MMLRHLRRPLPLSALRRRSLASAAGLEEDLLQRSALATDHFQASLPRLGVPRLEDSLRRYAASQSVLLDADAMAAHQRVVDEFAAGPGPDLQRRLTEFARQNRHTSYITGFWFDMYLRDRRPVPLTHTPFMSLKRDPRPAYNAVPVRTANIIYSSVRFARALRDGVLAPEVFHLDPTKSDTDAFRRAVSWCPRRIATPLAYLFKAYPLDMSQFANLFASTRLPRPDRDELRAWPASRHVVALRRGHLYTFDVLDASGRAVAPGQVLADVREVLGRAETNEHPVGVLTGAHRDTWTRMRQRLVELGNDEALEAVDSALFAISLDEEDPGDDVDRLVRISLHGVNPNRWFDKSISLVVTGGGDVAINFEHSWGDGVAVLRYFNELYKDSTGRPVIHPDTQVPDAFEPRVRRIDFRLDDGVRASIKEEWEKFQRKAAGLAIDWREIETFGKNDVKRVKISPDSVMQLAFQLSYYRMHGKAAPTYESCSTSAFKHGRTETVRSATPETLHFSKLAMSGRASPAELLDAMRKCSDKHNQLVREAAMGKGWDRHLFALRKMAEEAGSSPALFADPAYQYINHIILSTSTLSSPYVEIGGFAAVVPDGYGVGYAIMDNGLGCIVTAFPEEGGVSLTDFVSAFQDSAHDLKRVMDSHK